MSTLNVMWSNYWTTLVGAALAGLYYLDQIGTKLPSTSGEWLHVGVGLGLAVLGFVAKSATTGSVPYSARLLVGALLLGGCSTGLPTLPTLALPTHPQPASLSDVIANIKTDTPLDLDAATAIALAHKDDVAVACFPALKKFLAEQTGTATPSADQIKGVFSAYEAARVARIALEGSLAGGPALPSYLKLGCAALLQDERLFALRLAALIAGAQVGAPGLGGLLPK